MKATEFVKKEGLWVFEYALAQLSFNKDMFLVVYRYECEFVSGVKDNHGDCVFSYRDVKQIVEAFWLVEKFGGLIEAKKVHYDEFRSDINWNKLQKSITLVEQCQ